MNYKWRCYNERGMEIYIKLYSSLLIHKIVDGDENRICSLSSAAEPETGISLFLFLATKMSEAGHEQN